MNIYLLKRTDMTDYDEFDSFVIVAESARDALHTHPEENNFNNPKYTVDERGTWWDTCCDNEPTRTAYDTWTNINNVEITVIGVASETQNYKHIVCASFNAG